MHFLSTQKGLDIFGLSPSAPFIFLGGKNYFKIKKQINPEKAAAFGAHNNDATSYRYNTSENVVQ